MKREKQSGKSTAKFLGTILLCALLGGVAGYCAAANGDAGENAGAAVGNVVVPSRIPFAVFGMDAVWKNKEAGRSGRGG